jgi:hypothetical protein
LQDHWIILHKLFKSFYHKFGIYLSASTPKGATFSKATLVFDKQKIYWEVSPKKINLGFAIIPFTMLGKGNINIACCTFFNSDCWRDEFSLIYIIIQVQDNWDNVRF